MTALIRPFFQLCLLRMRPQDLPPSQFLLYITLVSHTVISVIGSTASYPLPKAIAAGTLETLVMAGLVAALLLAKAHPDRLVQTLTALAGANALLNFIALPMISLLPEVRGVTPEAAGGAAEVARLLLLVLLCWNVAVIGHVLRHALSVGMAFGIALSIGFVWLYWSVLELLLGPIGGGAAA